MSIFKKNAKNLKAVPKVIVEKEIKEAFGILAAFKWSKKELDLKPDPYHQHIIILKGIAFPSFKILFKLSG